MEAQHLFRKNHNLSSFVMNLLNTVPTIPLFFLFFSRLHGLGELHLVRMVLGGRWERTSSSMPCS